jgi:hypothetical protein
MFLVRSAYLVDVRSNVWHHNQYIHTEGKDRHPTFTGSCRVEWQELGSEYSMTKAVSWVKTEVLSTVLGDQHHQTRHTLGAKERCNAL